MAGKQCPVLSRCSIFPPLGRSRTWVAGMLLVRFYGEWQSLLETGTSGHVCSLQKQTKEAAAPTPLRPPRTRRRQASIATCGCGRRSARCRRTTRKNTCGSCGRWAGSRTSEPPLWCLACMRVDCANQARARHVDASCDRPCPPRRLRLLELALAELEGAHADPEAERRRMVHLYEAYLQVGCCCCWIPLLKTFWKHARLAPGRLLNCLAHPPPRPPPPRSFYNPFSNTRRAGRRWTTATCAGSWAPTSSAAAATACSTRSACTTPPSQRRSCRGARGPAPAAARSSRWGGARAVQAWQAGGGRPTEVEARRPC